MIWQSVYGKEQTVSMIRDLANSQSCYCRQSLGEIIFRKERLVFSQSAPLNFQPSLILIVREPCKQNVGEHPEACDQMAKADRREQNAGEDTREGAGEDTRENAHKNTHENVCENARENVCEDAHKNAHTNAHENVCEDARGCVVSGKFGAPRLFYIVIYAISLLICGLATVYGAFGGGILALAMAILLFVLFCGFCHAIIAVLNLIFRREHNFERSLIDSLFSER